MTSTRPTESSPARDDPAPFEPFRLRCQERLFDSLAEHVERLTWERATLEAFQTSRLRKVLATAIERSPFHAKRLQGVDPTGFELEQLATLPVMEKPTMTDRFDDVVTDRRLRRSDLERAIAETGEEPVPLLDEYVALTSGGSSGTRGLFVLDASAVAEFYASIVRPTGAQMMAQPPSEQEARPGVMIAASSPIHATGLSARLLAGAPSGLTAIPVTLPYDEIAARVAALDPGSILGYPSMIARLARDQLAGNLDITPTRVTVTSENLLPEARALIERAFGVAVMDTFGSSEGLVGSSDPGDDVLNFASDCCLVELVDEHDRPVVPGRASASILMTNLFNLTQPLIRYRIEDSFIQRPAAENHGHLRANVDGRASEVLRWESVAVHPVTIINQLLHTPAIADYLIRQTPSGVNIDVVTDTNGRIDDDVSTRVARALDDAGLNDAEVTVRIVDDIDRDSRTGKAARIVPLADST